MCGITVVYNQNKLKNINSIESNHKHRGPDNTKNLSNDYSHVIHDRLSINDLSSHGDQPLIGCDGTILVHNGEIYNKDEINASFANNHKFHGHSDSESILHLYEEIGQNVISKLDGVFFLALIKDENILIARDPFGVKPGYYGEDKVGNLYFSSEMKSIVSHCLEVKEFPPGHIYTNTEGMEKYYNPIWSEEVPTLAPNIKKIHNLLEKAVHKRLMSDVEIGAFLSGGLDSSLICAIAAKKFKEEGKSFKTFSIGIEEDSEDHKYAQLVADYIGSDHYKINFTTEQAIDLIPRVISHLETYDLTTVRSGIPLYILSSVATKKHGLKVVLCGEGSDEALGGYLYFKNAQNSEVFHKECVERLFKLHTCDVLRVDKSTMANSLEGRVPFLDLDFIDYVMSFDAKFKMHNTTKENPLGIEKYILRYAFDDNLLPSEVLWRQKEQFSDGVGYSWIDSLEEYANTLVSDDEYSTKETLYPLNTPRNKEEFLYRKIYNQIFSEKKTASISRPWVPKWQKSSDPSGRHCQNHTSING